MILPNTTILVSQEFSKHLITKRRSLSLELKSKNQAKHQFNFQKAESNELLQSLIKLISRRNTQIFKLENILLLIKEKYLKLKRVINQYSSLPSLKEAVICLAFDQIDIKFNIKPVSSVSPHLN